MRSREALTSLAAVSAVTATVLEDRAVRRSKKTPRQTSRWTSMERTVANKYRDWDQETARK